MSPEAKPSESPLLEASKLVLGYRHRAILPDFSVALWPSQITSIVGNNGSGKSTLLRTLLGLHKPISGTVTLSPGKRVGYVPQRESIDPIYPIRVEHMVETGRYSLLGVGRKLSQADHERVWQCMEATRVMTLSDRLFRTLSSGEQQRTLLARALACEPHILAVDEPTASMDEKGAREAIALALELATRKGASVLMINHSLELVAKVSDQVILLDRENKLVRIGHPSHVLPHWKAV